MKAEDQMRALAAEGTQGRLMTEDDSDFVCSPAREICDVGYSPTPKADARRIALMADAEVMRAVADYIAASRHFFLNMPTGNNEARAVEALSRLDALVEGRGDE